MLWMVFWGSLGLVLGAFGGFLEAPLGAFAPLEASSGGPLGILKTSFWAPLLAKCIVVFVSSFAPFL